MKKEYQKPCTSVSGMIYTMSVLANSFDGEKVTVVPEEMDEGDGSDAVKLFNDYDGDFTWGDLWGYTNELR